MFDKPTHKNVYILSDLCDLNLIGLFVLWQYVAVRTSGADPTF